MNLMQKLALFWQRHRREIVLLALVMGVAALLRLAALDRFPPGLYYDEAADAVDAVNTLKTGQWLAFYDTQAGKEAIWIWLQAATFALAGVGILQIRLTAAVVGLLTVLAVWWAAREIFSADEDPAAPDLALLSAAVLATLFIHVHFSRDGYRLLTQPLVGSLAIGALWRGLRGKGRGWLVLAGALLGLSLYTYSAARFYPILLAVFFPVEWLLSRSRATSALRVHFRWLAAAAVAALVVFAPMGLHLATQADFAAERADEVSVFNPTWNHGQPLAALFDSTWRNFAGLVWQGAEDRHWNIPGRPLLDGLTIPLFLLGTAVAVSRWRRRAYLFLLLWLVILYLPAILSYDRVPIFHRAQGATPAVVMLVAVGAWTAWQALARRLRLPNLGLSLKMRGVVAPLLIILLVSGTITGYDYFVRWGSSWDAYLATQPYWLDLVEQMNQEPEASAVYIFPYDLRNGVYEHPDLQLFYHGQAAYASVTDHEGELRAALTSAVAGRDVVRVVDWKVGRSAEADPKRLIPGLLAMRGQSLGVTSDTSGYRIESFRMTAPDVDFRPIPPLQAAGATVGDGLTLRAFAFGPAGQAKLKVGGPLTVGQPAWVVLTWQTAKPAAADYKVSVRLVGETGIMAQQDKLLLNGFHLATTQWHAAEENYDLYLLPLERAGRYHLQVMVYDSGTDQELLPGGLMLPDLVEVQP
jgi:4-amino-4-deoxy-L-arabinose transferase-like glycosyltransferase